MAEERGERTCYVICPIGEKGTPIRRRSDQVLKHLIKPAVARFGYDVRRSDSDATPGEIPAQIIRQMATADLVVADLSEFNPNVFYELAIRHVAAKPLVQIIAAGQAVPFDVGHLRTVYFNLGDPDELEEAREELAQHVDALKDVDEIETPVKASLRLKEALESSDPATAGNAEVLAELQAVRADVERLRATRDPSASHVYNPRSWLATGLTGPVNPTVAFPVETIDPVLFERPLSESQEDPAALLPDDREEEPKPRKARGRAKPKAE